MSDKERKIAATRAANRAIEAKLRDELSRGVIGVFSERLAEINDLVEAVSREVSAEEGKPYKRDIADLNAASAYFVVRTLTTCALMVVETYSAEGSTMKAAIEETRRLIGIVMDKLEAIHGDRLVKTPPDDDDNDPDNDFDTRH